MDYSFGRNFVYAKDRIYVLGQSPQETSTRVFRYTQKWDNYQLPFFSRLLSGVTGASPEVLCVGEFGEVHVASPGGFSTEQVDASEEGPQHRGALRGIASIDNQIYVCGMGRQVYRRETSGSWVRIDSAILEPLGSSSTEGFEAIDGFSKEEIYCAGTGGKLYYCENNLWKQVLLPARNSIIHSLCCASDGRVYAVGRSGMLLEGRKESWTVIPLPQVDDTLWGVHHFSGKLYLTGERSLYCYKNGELEEIDSMAFHFVNSSANTLCATGGSGASLFDGSSWSKLPELPW